METTTPDWLAEAREALVADGDYLAFDTGDRVQVVPLQDGWTRVGRSLSAHVRLDDPTVSRRHALIHRDEDGAQVLDDRSLNGVFLNGERVDLSRARGRRRDRRRTLHACTSSRRAEPASGGRPR